MSDISSLIDRLKRLHGVTLTALRDRLKSNAYRAYKAYSAYRAYRAYKAYRAYRAYRAYMVIIRR